ncbi:MAG TPA: DUF5723 family protein [Flavobacteriales bacterium]|nr:DUF5723 family protein [Flavobacteriales bacterium]HRP80432.1 DUF5723 family protein [Flavobacteriales bacterium]HRQ84546.1 DUF5723 family protein [Flavobacteriales bacterium]
MPSRFQLRSPFIGAFIASAFLVHGQADMSVFTTTGRAASTTFVTDYQAVGINPANLGWQWRNEGKHVAIGFAEGSYSVNSNALTRDDIRHRMLNTDFRFTEEQKVEAGRQFADAGVLGNVDLMLFGAAVTSEQAGGFAFQVRDRMQVSSRFGPLTAELAFLGFRSDYFNLLVLVTGDTIPNYENLSPDSIALIALGIASQPQLLSKVLDGSHLQASWYREFSFSYGRHLVRNDDLEIDAGIGLKYLLGIGVVDISAADGKASGFTAITSSLGFDVESGERRADAPSIGRSILSPTPAGNGFGVDLGLSVILDKKWKIGASVCNIGSINWNGDVYTAGDGSLIDLATNGLENYDLINGLEDFVTNSGALHWESGLRTRRALPSTARFGMGWVAGKHLELGGEVVAPLNQEPGNLQSTAFGLGMDLRPFNWLVLGTGISTGGGYGFKVPVGITFSIGNGTWEAGVASRDVVTFFTQRNPTLSLSMGFLRFRF